MDAAALIARLEEQRSHWADLPGGLRVRLRRPDEVDLGRFIGGIGIDAVCQYANDWEGFTEATFLGASIGASDPQPFDRDLWSSYVRDNIDAATACVKKLKEVITEHISQRDAAVKNSGPSSTPRPASNGRAKPHASVPTTT